MREEFFAAMDKLLQNKMIADSLRQAIRNPQPGIKIAKPQKLKYLLEAKAALEELLEESWEDGNLEIKIHPNFNAATLSVEVDQLEIKDYKLLWRVIGNARNVEFVPLTNGKLHIGLSFGNFFEIIDMEEFEHAD